MAIKNTQNMEDAEEIRVLPEEEQRKSTVAIKLPVEKRCRAICQTWDKYIIKI